MRILVVCGAGASSTFVAMRLRHAAQNAGLSVQAFAGTVESLAVDLDSADILLVGPHLAPDIADLERLATHRGVSVILLPEDVFADTDGSRTLRAVLPAITTASSPAPLSPASPSHGPLAPDPLAPDPLAPAQPVGSDVAP